MKRLAALAIVITTGCGATPLGTTESDHAGTLAPGQSSFPSSEEPIAITPGTYRIPKSGWSVADFTVTFPSGWAVQYGHDYLKNSDAAGELSVYAVTVDALFADACLGDEVAVEVGPSIDDLVTALRQQPGPAVSKPVETTVGDHAALRVDLSVPEDLDLETCRFSGVGLQVWYSAPADKYFILLADGIASVYILDINGQRQVFLTQYRSGASDADIAEMQTILDSIHIES